MMEIQPKDTSKNHFRISMVKSGVRILAGLCLIAGGVTLAGVLLIAAEGLGILVEIG